MVGEEQRAVRSAFTKLSDTRSASCWSSGWSRGSAADEVAELLDMRPGAVRTAQSRALDRLRTLLVPAEEVGS